MPLDPTVEAMLEQMAEADGPSLSEMSPPDARDMYRMLQANLPAPEVHSVEDMDANGVPVRVYKMSNEANQAVSVFYHGGGWVIGDLETHDGVCRQLAVAANCTVIAVDYRLAPEHPYPAAIDDCYEATRWVSDNAAELGIDKNRIAVAGDSAGGNLSACVVLKARAENGPAICFQLLIYPVTDAKMNTPSFDDNGDGYMLTRDTMQWFWNCYTDGQHLDDPLASPLVETDLSGLPPACVITAEYDPLRDEGEKYAKVLTAAGVEVNAIRFDGMIHGFFGMTDILEGAKAALDLAAAELNKAFKQ